MNNKILIGAALLLAIPTMSNAALIGDYVWDDANRNGVQDSGESGIPFVDVFLWEDVSGSTGALLQMTSSDVDGIYEFTGLDLGTYLVQFELPTGYLFTVQNAAGSTPDTDSDVDASGFARVFLSMETEDTIDAGYFCTLPDGCSTSAQMPAPATLALLGLGLTGFGYQRRKTIKAM